MPEDENKDLGAEQEQELGGSQESTLPNDLPSEPSGDPLDAIEDVSVLRSEAKKYREILKRKSKPDAPKEEAKAEPVTVQPTDALTKTDLYRINSQKAIKLAKADPELAENFEAVRALYVNRRGQEDPDAILEDLKDALIVYKARAKTNTDPAADLQTTAGVKRTSGAPAPTGERSTQPILRKSTSMTDWYTKKS